MDLQKINVKLFVEAPSEIRLDGLLPIFARWRADKEHPSDWIDLADYAHVPNGPGIMIIGQRGNLMMDLTDPGPGILYANKKDLTGNHETRILDSFRRALALTHALTEEPEYPADLSPRPGFWQLIFNDRLRTPNTDETEGALRPSINKALDCLFGTDSYTVIREKDPLLRYGFMIHSEEIGSLDAIVANL